MEEIVPTPVPVAPIVVPPRPAPRSQLPVLFGLLLALVLFVSLPYVAEQFEFAIVRGRERAQAEVARAELANLPDAINRFRLAAKAIEPSVVGVETVHAARGGRPVGDDSPGYSQYGMGQGSGVIVDAAGYIVTNSHVVDGAQEVSVRMSDGRTIRDVEFIGADSGSDIAVLRIRTSGLIAAPWGDSDKLEVGDQVLAVGSPYRLAQTVTAGIISAKDRRGIVETLDRQDFLQTDAAINPGNSGGPLVNLKGEVIGINTAIVGESYRGIGFSIPSRIAEDVYNRLKAGQKIPRGWLGVAMQDLNDRLADQFKLTETRGVIITDVVKGSPADRAGLMRGDVIVSWAGKPVADRNDLQFLVSGTKAGSVVKASIIRNGEKREVDVTIGERPSEYDVRRRSRK